MKEETEMTNTKNTETITKKKQKSIIKGYMDLEKSKKRNLNKARNNIMKRNKFNILGKAKQHLRECEVRNCQKKGGRGIINHVRMLTMWKRKMNNRWYTILWNMYYQKNSA